MKKDHLGYYAEACIDSWSEIANTADLQHVNFQMGRLAAYTKRFCFHVSNLQFCKELIYQYILLSITKTSVTLGSIALVHQSKYPNHEYKLEALLSEQKKTRESDRANLASIFNKTLGHNYTLIDFNPNCHVVCAFNKIPMNNDLFIPENYARKTEFNPEEEMPFFEGQEDLFTYFLKEVHTYYLHILKAPCYLLFN